MELAAVTELGKELGTEYYERLEAENILFFPKTPTEFSEEDRNVLLLQRQSGAAYHKNIAYRPSQAERFSTAAQFRTLARRTSSPLRRAMAGVAQGMGLGQYAASPYDVLMHRFHNFMKENRQFQETCRKDRWEFPPQSSWIVYTDMVSHAVLSGQYALEQKFIISHRAMQCPERAPLNVLERLTGIPLTWPA